MLKYSPDKLASAVASVINSAVARGDNLSAIIRAGILVPLPKPNKAKGAVTSLRPIVLLNSIRKALSLIVLKRISGDVSRHLGYVQSGFRPGRSTADVVRLVLVRDRQRTLLLGSANSIIWSVKRREVHLSDGFTCGSAHTHTNGKAGSHLESH